MPELQTFVKDNLFAYRFMDVCFVLRITSVIIVLTHEPPEDDDDDDEFDAREEPASVVEDMCQSNVIVDCEGKYHDIHEFTRV